MTQINPEQSLNTNRSRLQRFFERGIHLCYKQVAPTALLSEGVSFLLQTDRAYSAFIGGGILFITNRSRLQRFDWCGCWLSLQTGRAYSALIGVGVGCHYKQVAPTALDFYDDLKLFLQLTVYDSIFFSAP